MKKFLLFAIIFAWSVLSFAQSVSYTYKPLAAEGCSVTYSVAKQDSSYYIVVTIKSDRIQFLKETTMMIRNFNDEVLKLEGEHIGNGSETVGIVAGNMVLPVTGISTTAQFPITPEQMDILSYGVAKIRITAIPMNHERIFKKDKIGKKLFKYLKDLTLDENDF
jgi:hypothetical protein